MITDFDDMGCTKVLSDQCQSRDCRVELDKLHYANPAFKVTLFAIPWQMTKELCEWCRSNASWVELAVHGFTHSSNFECEKMTYDEFDKNMRELQPMIDTYFTKGFKAPGWQISDDIYRWLLEHGWWVADQSYNNVRRFKLTPGLKAYVNNGGRFVAWNGEQDTEIPQAWHGHTWNCVGNGIEETYPQVEEMVKNAGSFRFVSESL
jgi:hypothetical protein